MSDAAIVVENLTVRYGDVLAIDDATFSVATGTVCGLVGMNGSGKSTLFKALMGVVRPDSGTLLLGGDAPRRARSRGLIGYVPQSEAVDWSFPVSVRDVVMMGRYGRQGFTRRVRPVDRAAVDDALARVELEDLADRQIGRLSGGQRKRAFVARAIAQEAEVLLLDEPFAGVDKRTEGSLARLLRDLAAAGRTVLVSTHDLHGLPELCDEVVLFLHRPLLQAPVAEALRPDNIARAFGFDVLGRGDGSRDQGAA